MGRYDIHYIQFYLCFVPRQILRAYPILLHAESSVDHALDRLIPGQNMRSYISSMPLHQKHLRRHAHTLEEDASGRDLSAVQHHTVPHHHPLSVAGVAVEYMCPTPTARWWELISLLIRKENTAQRCQQEAGTITILPCRQNLRQGIWSKCACTRVLPNH